MSNVNILDSKGAKVGSFDFPAGFLPEQPHTHLMHMHVVRHLRRARAGTASTLTRSEVSGGGKKPWKQKGTGRARAGSIRSPLWKGGGVIFGPKPRSYDLTMSRKARRVALRSAVLAKLPTTVGVQAFGFQAPSTKGLVNFLRNTLKTEGKVLIILAEKDENVALSARNLPTVAWTLANQLSVKALLEADHVVATEAALKAISEVYTA